MCIASFPVLVSQSERKEKVIWPSDFIVLFPAASNSWCPCFAAQHLLKATVNCIFWNIKWSNRLLVHFLGIDHNSKSVTGTISLAAGRIYTVAFFLTVEARITEKTEIIFISWEKNFQEKKMNPSNIVLYFWKFS